MFQNVPKSQRFCSYAQEKQVEQARVSQCEAGVTTLEIVKRN